VVFCDQSDSLMAFAAPSFGGRRGTGEKRKSARE